MRIASQQPPVFAHDGRAVIHGRDLAILTGRRVEARLFARQEALTFAGPGAVALAAAFDAMERAIAAGPVPLTEISERVARIGSEGEACE